MAKRRPKRTPFSGYLPSGVVTNDAAEYADAWRAFAAPLCAVLDGTLAAFDPGVGIRARGGYIDLPAWVVAALNAVLEKGAADHGKRA